MIYHFNYQAMVFLHMQVRQSVDDALENVTTTYPKDPFRSKNRTRLFDLNDRVIRLR